MRLGQLFPLSGMNNTAPIDAELIEQFRSFCGVERYRKFLCTTNTRAVYKRRLLHWQQKLWDEFCACYPEYAHFSSNDLLAAFRICHVHEQHLLDDHVPAIYGNWQFPREYLTGLDNSFPLANMMYCGDSVERQRDANRNVMYCPVCRQALLEWNAFRTDKIGIP